MKRARRSNAERLLGISLIAGMLPLAGTIEVWVAALFIYIVLARLVFVLPLPPGGLAGRAAILGGGIAGIAMLHGSLMGLNAGLSLLGLLLGLKVLEIRKARDLAFTAHLALVLALVGFFVYQELYFAMYEFAVATLALAALAGLNAEPGADPTRAIRTAAVALLAGLPLAAVLFVVAPRTGAGFRWQLGSVSSQESGLSDKLEPGSFSKVALSTEIAFRVEFPEGPPPEPRERYWRAGVMNQGDNFNWEAGKGGTRPRELGEGPQTRDVRQRVMLEPHGGRWLPALDRPHSWVHRANLDFNYVLANIENVYGKKRYEVVSRLNGKDAPLPDGWRKRLTQLPDSLDPRVRELASGLKREDDDQTLRALLRHFQTGGYVYTLQPGIYSEGTEGLREFLFERREGFCEHYAAAFATLARMAGLPSRVVTGYQGGEMNEVSGHMTVRQSDAHAWCEVWTDATGWLRVDPTLVVAPGRISEGLDAFLEGREGGRRGLSGFAERSGLGNLLRGVRSLYDTLEYEWISRVVGFDAETQRSLFAFAGLARLLQPAALIAIGVVTAAVFVVGLRALPQRGKSRPTDKTTAVYRALRRRLTRFGVEDRPEEGPLDYALRARRSAPSHCEWIEEATDLYVRTRYSGLPLRERMKLERRLVQLVSRGQPRAQAQR